MMRDIENPDEIQHRTNQLNWAQGPNYFTYEAFITRYVNGGKRVLDFGSANHTDNTTLIGKKSAHQSVCESNHSVVAVDIVPHKLSQFNNSTYMTVNLLELGSEEQKNLIGHIDTFFAGNVIEHLSDPGQLFNLASNLLSVGDKLIITTVNPLWFIGLWDRLFLRYQSNCIDHTVILGPPEFLELAQRFGFELKEWNLIGKLDMTQKFEPGGRIIGRLIGALYRYARFRDYPFAFNLVGCTFTKK